MRGTMTVEVAGHGQGRTWDSCKTAYFLAMAGSRVTLVVPEMSEAQVWERLYRIHYHHDLGFQRRHPEDEVFPGGEVDEVSLPMLSGHLHEEMLKRDGEIRVSLSRSIEGVEAEMADSFSKGGTSWPVLVVNDLAGLDPGSAYRDLVSWRVLARISEELKRIATVHGAFVFVTAQQNDSGATRSSSMMHSADQVLVKTKYRGGEL